ncbi:TadE/TadG family type IV pilus assembly protein [Arthrobacter sp. GMC3]|uniref:TadE/TadG family type IV pilus assembly protein n=1 Tax=Arthrobacter sp. GMC3 TaxID=2058894 RepID=UPI0021580256|nr:TadE/TadG family type IV pilus assembly protein [Arthrobacter sp. GMC3]
MRCGKDARKTGGHPESGAAVVDFVLVSALVAIMFLALVQLALVLHVRNTVADAASSAARYGALADRTAQDAQERATFLIESALGGAYGQDVSATVTEADGIAILTVTVIAPLPLIGLLGPGESLQMSGHAIIPR